MKVGYRVNSGLFKKYAEEFFFAITKISYILLAVMAFFGVFFIFIGVFFNYKLFNSQSEYVITVVCSVLDLLIVIALVCVNLVNRKRFITNSMKAFNTKFGETTVAYTCEFFDNYFMITNDVNDDKKVIYDSEVKRVVVSKNIVSLVANDRVWFLNKQSLNDDGVEFIKQRYCKKQ